MNAGRTVLAVTILLAFASLSRGAGAVSRRSSICAPRAEAAPKIDGVLDDACRQTASAVRQFTQRNRADAPRKPIEVKVCFDDTALYIAVICGEPDPSKIKAERKVDGASIWRDDCVQLFLTPGGSGEYYQFVANTLGAREYHHAGGKLADCDWTVKATIGRKNWIAEFKIPPAA